jgi:hypothetical protein
MTRSTILIDCSVIMVHGLTPVATLKAAPPAGAGNDGDGARNSRSTGLGPWLG